MKTKKEAYESMMSDAPIKELTGDERLALSIEANPETAKTYAFKDINSLSYATLDMNYDDVLKASSADIASKPGVVSAIKTVGYGALAFAPLVGKVIGGALVLGADAYAIADNMSKSNEEFWIDYQNNMMNVEGNSVMDNVLAGYANVGSGLLGENMPDVVKDSGGYVVGNLAGHIIRDIAFMKMGTSAVSKVAQKTNPAELARIMESAGKTGMIGGMATTSAISAFQTKKGMGESTTSALRAGVATGLASGLTGWLFMSKMDRVLTKIAPSMLEPGLGRSIRFGAEMSTWGVAEDFARVSGEKLLGNESEEYHVDYGTTAAMFVIGTAGAMFLGGSKNVIKNVLNKTKDKKANIKNVAEGAVDAVEENITDPEYYYRVRKYSVERVEVKPTAEAVKIAEAKQSLAEFEKKYANHMTVEQKRALKVAKEAEEFNRKYGDLTYKQKEELRYEQYRKEHVREKSESEKQYEIDQSNEFINKNRKLVELQTLLTDLSNKRFKEDKTKKTLSKITREINSGFDDIYKSVTKEFNAVLGEAGKYKIKKPTPKTVDDISMKDLDKSLQEFKKEISAKAPKKIAYESIERVQTLDKEIRREIDHMLNTTDASIEEVSNYIFNRSGILEEKFKTEANKRYIDRIVVGKLVPEDRSWYKYNDKMVDIVENATKNIKLHKFPELKSIKDKEAIGTVPGVIQSLSFKNNPELKSEIINEIEKILRNSDLTNKEVIDKLFYNSEILPEIMNTRSNRGLLSKLINSMGVKKEPMKIDSTPISEKYKPIVPADPIEFGDPFLVFEDSMKKKDYPTIKIKTPKQKREDIKVTEKKTTVVRKRKPTPKKKISKQKKR